MKYIELFFEWQGAGERLPFPQWLDERFPEGPNAAGVAGIPSEALAGFRNYVASVRERKKYSRLEADALRQIAAALEEKP